jgi:transcriptional regulator with XRE-family HTH domain
MNEVIKLLDKCKEISSSTSDNALAIKMGVTRQMISNWRLGKNYPDTVNCAKIAELTGTPLAKVLGVIGEARAISEAEKKVWRRLANMASATAGCVAMIAMLGFFSSDMMSAMRIVCILC